MPYSGVRLAESFTKALDEFTNTAASIHASPAAVAGGGFMLSSILKALGVKEEHDSIVTAIHKLQSEAETETGEVPDFLNEDHRNYMANLLRKMFEPMAVQYLLIIGISSDDKTFITKISKDTDPPLTSEQVRSACRSIAESEDVEELPL